MQSPPLLGKHCSKASGTDEVGLAGPFAPAIAYAVCANVGGSAYECSGGDLLIPESLWKQEVQEALRKFAKNHPALGSYSIQISSSLDSTIGLSSFRQK